MVVGVDGSIGSNHALLWAAAHTVDFGPLRPVMAWRYPYFLAASPAVGFPLPPSEDELKEAADKRVEEALAECGVDKFEPPTTVEAAAGPTLVRLGKDANLIVVGTRGRGAALDTLLGSVSTHVVSHADVPVAVVPEEAPLDQPLDRVVVAIDGSDTSVAALAWAMDQVPAEADIEVLHVWHYALVSFPEAGPIPADISENGAKETMALTLAAARAKAVNGSRPLTERLEYGDPRNVIRDTTKAADLLVLGAQGHHGVAHLLLGSVTTALIHQPLTVTIVVPAVAD